MTWSLVNSLAVNASSLNKTELEAPFIYFYETFLPSKGWAVTKDESGGASQITSSEQWYGLSKSFTFADGYTVTRHMLHEIEYASSDIVVYGWDGTPGAGQGSTLFSDSTWTNGLRSGLTNWHFLASDEDLDAWCVFANKGLVYWSHPSTGLFSKVADSFRFNQLGPLVCQESSGAGWVAAIGNSPMYSGFGPALYGQGYLMTPAFSYMSSANSDLVGMNTVPDTYQRITNTTVSYRILSSQFPSSVLIDGEYYLDLYPAEAQSLMLNTGATDLGVLS